MGPPGPGEPIGPVAADPYSDYIPFSDGQESYLVPPNSVVAMPGRGMLQGTAVHIPGYEEERTRGINIVGAVAGLVGNGLEATGAFFLGIAPEPTLLTKVGAGALGVLAADGAQANVRTLWNGGVATPTVLNRTVTTAAGTVMSPEAAERAGVLTDVAAHTVAQVGVAYKLPNLLGSAGPASALAEEGAPLAHAIAPSSDVAQGYTRAYRAVSEAEYQQILRTGTFEVPPGGPGFSPMEGKWFADSVEGATAHGNALQGPR